MGSVFRNPDAQEYYELEGNVMYKVCDVTELILWTKTLSEDDMARMMLGLILSRFKLVK